MKLQKIIFWLNSNPILTSAALFSILTYGFLFDLYIENSFLSSSVASVRETLMVKKSRELDRELYKRQLALFEEGNEWLQSQLAYKTFEEQVKSLHLLVPEGTIYHELNYSFEPIYYKRFSISQETDLASIQNMIHQLLIEHTEPIMFAEVEHFRMVRDGNSFKSKLTIDTLGYKNEE